MRPRPAMTSWPRPPQPSRARNMEKENKAAADAVLAAWKGRVPGVVVSGYGVESKPVPPPSASSTLLLGSARPTPRTRRAGQPIPGCLRRQGRGRQVRRGRVAGLSHSHPGEEVRPHRPLQRLRRSGIKPGGEPASGCPRRAHDMIAPGRAAGRRGHRRSWSSESLPPAFRLHLRPTRTSLAVVLSVVDASTAKTVAHHSGRHLSLVLAGPVSRTSTKCRLSGTVCRRA